jgi:hypothetical protein
MIEVSARRRLASGLRVQREAVDATGDNATSRDVLRWGRGFFERVQATLLPRTALVARTPEGELRYYGSSAFSLWAFVTAHATTLAYDVADTEAQIRERARRWLACLTTRTAPGLASPHWGHPLYGARLDPMTGELDVVWAVPGDWVEAVLAGALPERQWDVPPTWEASLVEVG